MTAGVTNFSVKLRRGHARISGTTPAANRHYLRLSEGKARRKDVVVDAEHISLEGSDVRPKGLVSDLGKVLTIRCLPHSHFKIPATTC